MTETVYRNHKTGKRYLKLAYAIDTTNERDGLIVVVYCPDDDENTIYVIEENQFYEKFYLSSDGDQ